MMSKRTIQCIVILPVVVWILGFAFVSLKGYSIQDNGHLAVGLMTGLAVVVLYLVLLAFTTTRIAARIALVILVTGGPAVLALRQYRLHLAIQKLEVIYGSIASRGPPFPATIDPAHQDGLGYLHWYYQKNSGDRFAIVYIDSSNGYAMEYPGGQWRFINYMPNGYNPDPAHR